jgi:hypothetical protein
MVGGPDPRDAALGRRDDLLEGVAGEVGQLGAFEVGSEDAARLVW